MRQRDNRQTYRQTDKIERPMPDRLQRDRQVDGQKSSDRKTNKQAEKQLMRAIQTD